MQPLDRNQFVARKLGKLNNQIILDIGCRDQVFKKSLLGNFEYIGVDYDTENENTEFINHNLEQGLPKQIGKIDIINAMDVLEHVENIHDIFNECLEKSEQKVAIALPNMAYYKFRLAFLFSGEISGKYIFHSKKIIDRHRWFTTYYNNINFVKTNTPKNWRIKHYNFIAQRKRNFIFYHLEKILSKLFPKFFVYENIFIIEKV
jgi:2-polyprenyl-3-methyl-5-hydroxy-6-metoxy-1,4-benzoquinol methylase